MNKILPGLLLLAALSLHIPVAHSQSTDTDGTRHNSSQSVANKLDLNVASLAELQTLPGVGVSKAKAIINYREQVGPFLEVAQLTEVKGIGNKMLSKIQSLVKVD
ncbi:ComEA family DNA-binding protein [Alteromonas sp. P256]|uniref:ComEA family DNA-binding protein n=1 Tax=Alteromonas sp. P256 TaxID=3117399 RepID=UPI002FE05645